MPQSLDWKPPYLAEPAGKPYISEYKVPKFQKYDDLKENTKEHVLEFLDFMGPYAHNTNLCLKQGVHMISQPKARRGT